MSYIGYILNSIMNSSFGEKESHLLQECVSVPLPRDDARAPPHLFPQSFRIESRQPHPSKSRARISDGDFIYT